jgi:hypothetical protein
MEASPYLGFFGSNFLKQFSKESFQEIVRKTVNLLATGHFHPFLDQLAFFPIQRTIAPLGFPFYDIQF